MLTNNGRVASPFPSILLLRRYIDFILPLSLSFSIYCFWESRFLDYGKFASCIYFLPSSLPLFPFQKVIRYRRHTVDSCCRQQQQQPIYQSPIVVDGRNTRRKLEIATQHKVAGCIRTQYKHGEVGTLYSSRSELWGGWRRKMSVCKEHLAISADTFSNYNRIFGALLHLWGRRRRNKQRLISFG